MGEIIDDAFSSFNTGVVPVENLSLRTVTTRGPVFLGEWEGRLAKNKARPRDKV